MVQLHKYNPHLDIIIKNKKTKAELIITAHGNPYLFKDVELLVYHAPKIKRWHITAFLQPQLDIEQYEKGLDKALNYYGISLRISEMYFTLLPVPNKPFDFGIKVFLKNYFLYEDHPRLQDAVFVQIEHLIGEKLFANTISFIEIDQLEIQKGYDYDLINLYYLHSYLETFLNSKIKNSLHLILSNHRNNS